MGTFEDDIRELVDIPEYPKDSPINPDANHMRQVWDMDTDVRLETSSVDYAIQEYIANQSTGVLRDEASQTFTMSDGWDRDTANDAIHALELAGFGGGEVYWFAHPTVKDALREWYEDMARIETKTHAAMKPDVGFEYGMWEDEGCEENEAFLVSMDAVAWSEVADRVIVREPKGVVRVLIDHPNA